MDYSKLGPSLLAPFGKKLAKNAWIWPLPAHCDVKLTDNKFILFLPANLSVQLAKNRLVPFVQA